MKEAELSPSYNETIIELSKFKDTFYNSFELLTFPKSIPETVESHESHSFIDSINSKARISAQEGPL